MVMYSRDFLIVFYSSQSQVSLLLHCFLIIKKRTKKGRVGKSPTHSLDVTRPSPHPIDADETGQPIIPDTLRLHGGKAQGYKLAPQHVNQQF